MDKHTYTNDTLPNGIRLKFIKDTDKEYWIKRRQEEKDCLYNVFER